MTNTWAQMLHYVVWKCHLEAVLFGGKRGETVLAQLPCFSLDFSVYPLNRADSMVNTAAIISAQIYFFFLIIQMNIHFRSIICDSLNILG